MVAIQNHMVVFFLIIFFRNLTEESLCFSIDYLATILGRDDKVLQVEYI
jgi:hypothetical protein